MAKSGKGAENPIADRVSLRSTGLDGRFTAVRSARAAQTLFNAAGNQCKNSVRILLLTFQLVDAISQTNVTVATLLRLAELYPARGIPVVDAFLPH
jgi:hypothetical protein